MKQNERRTALRSALLMGLGFSRVKSERHDHGKCLQMNLKLHESWIYKVVQLRHTFTAYVFIFTSRKSASHTERHDRFTQKANYSVEAS